MKIEKLILQSKNLSAQFRFYVKTLGMEPLERTENSFAVKAGNSTLVFKRSANTCYYHFAFNIPPFRINEALNWARQRLDILEYEGKSILDFPNWNAKAFYFFDVDGNIVEFIDRRNLAAGSDKDFSPKDILEISETGLPVDDILSAFQMLSDQTGIKKYSGNLENFCAAGDEHGLFIIVDQNDKKWLPTEKQALAFPFEMDFKIDDQAYNLKYSGKEVLVNENPRT